MTVAKVQGAIGPVTARFFVETIEHAEERNAACVVFELDTPGGLDDSMRTIVKKIMASRVPVVVYIAPAGSRAASAGAFIAMSAHVAAMAPGTAIGAAHPVALGPGAGADTNLAAKAANDAAAFIRSIAENRGRNIEWANAAVKESVSLTEKEALQQNVVDLVAPSLPALLDTIDGRSVTVGTNSVTLATRNAAVARRAMNWRDNLLATLSNPNVAYILFMIGLLGLYFEFSNPGAIFPGLVGGISLILALFAFQTLSVNFAGILLILMAIVLFIVDVKTGTYGILSVGGVVAMFIGSVMLFEVAGGGMRVSMNVIVPVVLVTAAFFIVAVWLSIRTLAGKPVSGREGLIGEEGDARTPVNANGGQVFVAGAHWNARADTEIPQGSRVRVAQVSGMTLKVEPSKSKD